MEMDLMIGQSPQGGVGNKLMIDGPYSGMGGGFYTSRPVTSGGAFPKRNQHYHAQQMRFVVQNASNTQNQLPKIKTQDDSGQYSGDE